MRAMPSSASRSCDGSPSMIMALTGSALLPQTCAISASVVRPGMSRPDAPAAAYALPRSIASPAAAAEPSPCSKNWKSPLSAKASEGEGVARLGHSSYGLRREPAQRAPQDARNGTHRCHTRSRRKLSVLQCRCRRRQKLPKPEKRCLACAVSPAGEHAPEEFQLYSKYGSRRKGANPDQWALG